MPERNDEDRRAVEGKGEGEVEVVAEVVVEGEKRERKWK